MKLGRRHFSSPNKESRISFIEFLCECEEGDEKATNSLAAVSWRTVQWILMRFYVNILLENIRELLSPSILRESSLLRRLKDLRHDDVLQNLFGFWIMTDLTGRFSKLLTAECRRAFHCWRKPSQLINFRQAGSSFDKFKSLHYHSSRRKIKNNLLMRLAKVFYINMCDVFSLSALAKIYLFMFRFALCINVSRIFFISLRL